MWLLGTLLFISGVQMMKTKFLLLGVLTVTAMLAAFWLHATPKPQDRKVRVLVFRANDEAGAIVQSIGAKFNSTMRYETVDTMKTDLFLLVGCL